MASDMFSVPNTSGYPTPASYPDLRAWYKASDFDKVAHGREVVEWDDCAGAAEPMPLTALFGPGNRPTVDRNSINTTMTSLKVAGLRGLGSNRNSAFLTSKNIWSMFSVVKFANQIPSENDYFNCFQGSGAWICGINSNGSFLLTYGNIGAFNNQGMLSLNNWHYIIVTNNSGASLYVDGQSAWPWTSTPTTPNNNAVDIRLLDGNGSSNAQLSLAEAGIYNRLITAAEINGLVAYFRDRYGLT